MNEDAKKQEAQETEEVSKYMIAVKEDIANHPESKFVVKDVLLPVS